ncbi:MAG: DNA recombination protein RmuC [Ruminococcus sp.]|nr:DNA recombination protein RmuC [Ruminococcus sp.]
MEAVILAAVLIEAVLLAVICVKLFSRQERGFQETADRLSESFRREQSELRRELSGSIQSGLSGLGGMVTNAQTAGAAQQREKLEDLNTGLTERLGMLEKRFATLEAANEQKMENLRRTLDTRLQAIQEANTRQLEAMQTSNSKRLEAIQETVNEKLDARLNESFKQVSERLEQVYKGLGEMQSIAVGVGDLKRVLTNVKNRGIMGEIQLGAILDEILTRDQYDTEKAVVPGSRNHVEFAVKLPGAEKGSTVYLPIDSKFPGDTYAALQDAYDTGDPEAVAAAKRQLTDVIKKCAKDIREKYIAPPHTTNFAIMFLPFEGLYAEVVNSGIVDELQRKYSVNIAGPSTMSALLNSLRMGFQTLEIQQRSGEVWNVLNEVRTEFGKFDEALRAAQKQINNADRELEKLVGTRTRQLNRKLELIGKLDLPELAGERGRHYI